MLSKNGWFLFRWISFGILLRVQAGQLGQQQAVALCDGLLGGGSSQMALKSQDLLLLSLGNLKLPVDHLCLCVLISDGTRGIRVITVMQQHKTGVKSCSYERKNFFSFFIFYLLCHNHLHEHFKSWIAIPSSQTWRKENVRILNA